MNRIIFLSLLLFASIFSHAYSYNTYEEFYEAFTEQKLDEAETYDVSGFLFEEQGFSFSVVEGTLTFCTQINEGLPAMAVFVGKANMSSWQTDIKEKDGLIKAKADITLNKVATRAVFTFSGDFLALIKQDFPKITIKNKKEAYFIQKDCMKKFDDSRNNALDNAITKAFINGIDNEYMSITIKTEDNREYFYYKNYLTTEINIGGGLAFTNLYYDPMIHYFPDMDFAESEIGVTKTFLESNVDDDGDFEVNSIIKCKINRDYKPWHYIELNPNFNIKQFKYRNEFAIKNKQYGRKIWFRIPESLTVGDTFSLGLSYKFSSEFRKIKECRYSDNFDWHPVLDNNHEVSFDIAITNPEDVKMICIGGKSQEIIMDGETTTYWGSPAKYSSINMAYGNFKISSFIKDKCLPIDIYRLPDSPLPDSISTNELVTNIWQCLDYYSQIMGKLPYSRITIVEDYVKGTNSAPGIIYLNSELFKMLPNDWRKKSAVSREILRQWFGWNIKAKYRNENWIFEGLSDYLGLRCSYLSSEDKVKFFDMIRWSDNSSMNISQLFNKEHFKGIWLIHMLKHYTMDLNKMGDESKFNEIIRAFYIAFNGEYATSRDLKSIVEANLQKNMDWFFRQWVDSDVTPIYHYSYKTDKLDDGRYKVTMKVQQKNVKPDFAMVVPVLVKFNENKCISVQTVVTGESSTIELPLLPYEPIDIILNDLESVNCHVHKFDWKEKD